MPMPSTRRSVPRATRCSRSATRRATPRRTRTATRSTRRRPRSTRRPGRWRRRRRACDRGARQGARARQPRAGDRRRADGPPRDQRRTPDAVKGTELDPTALRARREKLIGKAEELLAEAGAGGVADARRPTSPRSSSRRCARTRSATCGSPAAIRSRWSTSCARSGSKPARCSTTRIARRQAQFDELVQRVLEAAGAQARPDADREDRGGGRDRDRRRRRERRPAEQAEMSSRPAERVPVVAAPVVAAPVVAAPAAPAAEEPPPPRDVAAAAARSVRQRAVGDPAVARTTRSPAPANYPFAPEARARGRPRRLPSPRAQADRRTRRRSRDRRGLGSRRQTIRPRPPRPQRPRPTRMPRWSVPSRRAIFIGDGRRWLDRWRRHRRARLGLTSPAGRSEHGCDSGRRWRARRPHRAERERRASYVAFGNESGVSNSSPPRSAAAYPLSSLRLGLVRQLLVLPIRIAKVRPPCSRFILNVLLIRCCRPTTCSCSTRARTTGSTRSSARIPSKAGRTSRCGHRARARSA